MDEQENCEVIEGQMMVNWTELRTDIMEVLAKRYTKGTHE